MSLRSTIKRNRTEKVRGTLAPLIVIILVAVVGAKVLWGIHADTGGYFLGANGQEFNPTTSAYNGQLKLTTSSGSILPWQTKGNVGGQASFSPDGSHLLVLSNSYPRFLILANANGTNTKKIIVDSKLSQTQNMAFSPDSSKFAVLSWLFTPSGNPNGLELTIYSKSGNVLTSTIINPTTSLTEDGNEGFGWSPDGSNIAIFGAESVLFNLASQSQTVINPLTTPMSSLNIRFIGWTSNSKSMLFSSETNSTSNGTTYENYSLNSVSVESNASQQTNSWKTIITYTTPMLQTSHYDLIDARYDPLNNKIYYRVPNGSAAGFYVTNLNGTAQQIAPARSCSSYYTNEIAVSADGQEVVIGCDYQISPKDIIWSSSQNKIVATVSASYPLTDNGSYQGSWRQ